MHPCLQAAMRQLRPGCVLKCTSLARVKAKRTGESMASMGMPPMSLRRSAAACRCASCLMTWYTVRCITHSLQSVVAFTVAALGAEYSSASSPKPLQQVHEVSRVGSTSVSDDVVHCVLHPPQLAVCGRPGR